MQRTKARISMLMVIVCSTFAACLRFYQLLFLTDSTTGYLTTDDGKMTYFIYGGIGLSFLFTLLYAYFMRESGINALAKKAPKYVKAFSFTVCAAFFIDFLHQCVNCVRYIVNTEYFDFIVIVPIVLTAVFALLSCFYFYAVWLTAIGADYDFRSFRYFHFAPIMWGLARLFGILIKMLDLISTIENVIEFLYLVASICFLFMFITVSDKDGGVKLMPAVMTVSAVMSLALAQIYSLPRLIILFIGHGEMLYSAVFTCITDIAIGLFAMCLIYNWAHRGDTEHIIKKITNKAQAEKIGGNDK